MASSSILVSAVGQRDTFTVGTAAPTAGDLMVVVEDGVFLSALNIPVPENIARHLEMIARHLLDQGLTWPTTPLP
jgi:hypothetical protein